jgi:Ca2+-binding RTX toxin-like protein
MTTEIEYAQLSARVYAATPRNRIPVPTGWAELEWIPDRSYGLSAGVYKKGNAIVIAFTGTNERKAADLGWGAALAATGAPSPQVTEAMLLYMTVRRENPGAEITFTGHSLGAGIASMMSIFFDRPATVFDAAPFELGARNLVSLGIYKTEIAAAGFSDAAFDAYWAAAPTVFYLREAKVRNIFIKGEFLEALRTPLTAIGTSAPPLDPGSPTAVSAFGELHSMTLLASMLVSTAFADAVRADAGLMAALFDPSLYARNPETFAQPDLLTQLYSAQVGALALPLLDRFAADLQRANNTAGMTGQPAVLRALTVAAMEYYYFKDAASATALFSTTGNGIHFKYGDIGQAMLGLKSPRLLDNAVQAYLTTDEIAAVGYRLATQDSWHIQTGTAGMTWTASAAAYDAAIGGAQSDVFDGGVGDDILIGGAGNDSLIGGANADTLIGGVGVDRLDGGSGNDKLLGGQGADTYHFAAGWGADTIADSDHDGVLQIDGFAGALPQGRKIGVGKYQSADLKVTYTLAKITDTRTDLAIAFTGIADSITIQNWTSGQFGITFNETPTPPTSVVLGDTKPNVNDSLSGTSGADSIVGLTGNDALSGGGDNDVIEGGIGSDVLAGGMGADVLNGGDGADYIFGSADAGTAAWSDLRSEWIVVNSNGSWSIPGAGGPAANDQGNVIDAGAGNDWVAAGTGGDVVYGAAGGDLVYAMAGNDYVDGGTDADELHGDSSNIAAGNYNTTAPADNGADTLVGGAGAGAIFVSDYRSREVGQGAVRRVA